MQIPELIAILSPTIATLPPKYALAVANLVRVLLESQTEQGKGDEAAVKPDLSYSPDLRPDSDFAAKGKRFYRKWHERVLSTLVDGPRARDDLAAAVKGLYGACLPPYALSYLLHFMWSKGDVEARKEDTGAKIITRWYRLKPVHNREKTVDPQHLEVEPELSRKIEWTEETITDWMWEFLGSFPHYRCDRPEAIAALLAAGAPEQLESMRLTKSVGNTFGQDKVDFLYIKDRERGNDQNWLMRVVDEDGQPIKRDDSGDIIS